MTRDDIVDELDKIRAGCQANANIAGAIGKSSLSKAHQSCAFQLQGLIERIHADNRALDTLIAQAAKDVFHSTPYPP